MSGSLPASSFGLPVGSRLTTAGVTADTELVMVATDTGLLWRASVSGSPPVWGFVAAPSCDDIAGDFPPGANLGAGQLAAAVGSCDQLLSWGF